MRRLVFLLLATAVFARCGDRPRQTDAKAVGDSVVRATDPEADTLASVQGLWVNKIYIDTLKATRSPRAAQEVADESCLYFPVSIRQPVLAVLGFHEGTDYHVLRSQKGDSLYDPSAKRNFGAIELISPTEIRIGRKHFIKLQHPDMNNRMDFNILEELLFAGGYRAENGGAVTFTPDGKVIGLDTIRFFAAQADYEGPGSDVDQVEMGADKNNMTWYAFRFDKDTLSVFKMKCLAGYDSTNNSCGIVDYGELRWKMVRKK